MIQATIAAFVDSQLAAVAVFAHRRRRPGSFQRIEGYLFGAGQWGFISFVHNSFTSYINCSYL
jgi:hypothetical protein